NFANSSGGGILNGGTMLISNSTFSGNSTNGTGGGIRNSETLTVENTIIADSTNGGNCSGTITSNGYNLDSDGTCNLGGLGDLHYIDPQLGSLQDNGGDTFTHALLSNSPAINAGSTNLAEDQRDVTRPSVGISDIGAFEYVPSCDSAAWSAQDEQSLNNAILCFNSALTTGTYTISLTQNISLTASTQPITNTVSGVELIIEGIDFTVDGQNLPDVRPFHIMADTIVTLQNITVTGGYAAGGNGGGGGILSFGTLAITNSTITDNRSISVASGGGIESYGPLTIENSVISHNSSDIGAGIYHKAAADLLSISNSIIKDNNATDFGGGIALENSVAQISHSTVQSNTSGFDGGGIYATNSTLTITNSTFSGNETGDNGGGISSSGTATILSSTFSGNSAANNGGGLYRAGGTLRLSNSIIANSSSGNNCSGTITSYGYNLDSDGSCNLVLSNDIPNQDPLLGPLQDNGGPSTSSGQATFTHALEDGSPAINRGQSSFSDDQRGTGRPKAGVDDIGAYEYVPNCNAASWSASDEQSLNKGITCYNSATAAAMVTISLTQNISLTLSTIPITNTVPGMELTIDGNGYTVDGQKKLGVRPFTIMADTTVTLQNITVTGGKVGADILNGGGILSEGTLTITHSTVKDNSTLLGGTGAGGGVYSRGPLTIESSVISGNSSDTGGGGVYHSAPTDTLIISNSTIHGNSTPFYGGGLQIDSGLATISHSTVSSNTALFDGGGMLSSSNSTISVTNSTFSGNEADNNGGGISSSGTVTILSSTFSSNSAENNGGGLYRAGGTLRLSNSIIANSSSGSDCSGTITSDGYNLDSDGSCSLAGTGDLSNQDPLLGPLQDNGGATLTHALLESSPAINAGNSNLAEDQRGITRPQGNGDDIGAFELVDPDPVDPDPVDPDPVDPDPVDPDPVEPDPVEPANGSTVENSRPTFEWKGAFDEGLAVVSYTLTITQTDAPRTVDVTVYTFETSNMSLTAPVDLSAGNYVWSVEARDGAGDVLAQTAEFSFVLDVDEDSEPAEPTVQRIYLPILNRP
ncbi:MAG: choice-of-anchor Q domain-containing protein, partial [Chloroflexota bacterium]